jgi:subtilase family protein
MRRHPSWLGVAAALLGVAGCRGDIQVGASLPAPDPSRELLGVAGKPIVATSTGPVIGDELLVRLDDGVTLERARAIAASAGAVVEVQAPGTKIFVFRFADHGSAWQGMARLSGAPQVRDISLNHILEGAGVGTSASLVAEEWNLPALVLDPAVGWGRADSVVVAVLDTGVAFENYQDALGTYQLAPDLAQVSFVPGYDFINNDAHPNDDQRHGTHVTGMIAASSGIAPMAPGATIMPIKVLGAGNTGTELALAEGLMFAADHGADIANMSLAFPASYFPSSLLQKAVDYAAQHGVIMIAAAGNHSAGSVSYPAAFRDVIAVGASRLSDSYVPPATGWTGAYSALQLAEYSDHGYKLDVLAPGGSISTDLNHDGVPEALIAQAFAPGNPGAFKYVLYAGTSQAAAQVSGLAAVMKATNPGLDATSLRALIDDNAGRIGFNVITSNEGRGYLRGDKVTAAAASPHATDRRTRYFTDVSITLRDSGTSSTVADANVEVLDNSGRLVVGAKVYGTYTGSDYRSVVATTDLYGIAHFTSASLAQPIVVGFQVDAVVGTDFTGTVFDRPRGFIRIDAVSLAMMASFGKAIVASMGTSGSGVATSPTGGGTVDGSGIGTSATAPVTLSTDPGQTPISIAFDPRLFGSIRYHPTLLLPSFSWGLAVAPMAIAVDQTWFESTFANAKDRRALSYGRGWGSSPLYFNGTSFPISVPVPTDSQRLSIVLLTFTSGVATSPTGIGTSATGIGTSATGIVVDAAGSGLSSSQAAEMNNVLSQFYAAAAGVATSPTYVSGQYTMTQSQFNQLSSLFQGYAAFAPLDVAAPASAYGATLRSAGMDLIPGTDPAASAGAGSVTQP